MARSSIRIEKVADSSEIAKQFEPKMQNLGQAIGARAQRLVPKRTFALHDTISAETKRDGAKVTTTVGAGSGDVDYAMYVERGTSKMFAQPYLRPAFMQTTGKDLAYAGTGITTHGVVSFSTRRSRVRGRSQGGRR